MQVQMIELEEITTVDLNDSTLEASCCVQARYTDNVQQWYGLIC